MPSEAYLFDSIFFSFLVYGEFESLKGSGMRRCQVVTFNGKLKFWWIFEFVDSLTTNCIATDKQSDFRGHSDKYKYGVIKPVNGITTHPSELFDIQRQHTDIKKNF
jgi:hypothetical protein